MRSHALIGFYITFYPCKPRPHRPVLRLRPRMVTMERKLEYVGTIAKTLSDNVPSCPTGANARIFHAWKICPCSDVAGRSMKVRLK